MKQIFEGDLIVTHMMRKRFRNLDQGSTCKKNSKQPSQVKRFFCWLIFFIYIIFSPQPLSFFVN